jgi:hypothetical protein
VLSGIAMGQSPFTIMAQQGGQFYQILADIGGGQGLGALKRGLMTAGATALSVFTPAKVAIGGVAAAIGNSLLAWNSYNNAQKEVAVSLGGLGRTSGLTQQAVNEMAKSTAEASHVSVSSAREMTSAFASLGISGEVIPKLNALVKDFAATTGQSAADATQELGKAFADPARGAEELNKKLGILNAGQLDYIQNLQASGDKAKAATVLATALPDALVKASDVTGTLSEGVKKDFANLYNAVGEFMHQNFGKLSAAERLEELTRASREAEEAAKRAAAAVASIPQGGPVIGPTGPPPPVQQNDPRGRYGQPALLEARSDLRAAVSPESVAYDQEQVRRDQALAYARQQSQDAREASHPAAAAAAAAFPEINQFKLLNAEISAMYTTLKEAKINPDIVPNVKALAANFEGANRQLGTFVQENGKLDVAATRFKRGNEDIKNQTALIRALGGEQLRAATTQSVLTEADRRGLDVADQRMAVDKALTPIIEQQNVAARNRTIQHEANLKTIAAFTQGEIEAAAATQAFTAVRLNQGTVEQANLAASQAAAEVRAKDVAQVRNIERAHSANMAAIKAETQAEVEHAAGMQAAAQYAEGSAAASKAYSAAKQEAAAKDIATARQIQRVEVANLQAIQARTVAERQAAAARTQARRAQHPIGRSRTFGCGRDAAATAASNQVLAEYNRQQEDATRIGLANIQMIMAKTTSQRAAAASAQELADGTEKYAQAEAAANAVRAEAATKARDMVDAVKAAVQQVNIQTAVVSRQISPEVGAFRGVQAQGEAQIKQQGLEGPDADKVRQSFNELAIANYNHAVAQRANSEREKEAAELLARNHEALARDAQMASEGITSMGVALKNIVHDTTISAQDAAGKTLGAGVTLTGILTEEGWQRAARAQQATERLHALQQAHANDNFIQTQKGLRDNAASIGSPLAGLVDTLGDNMKSAQDKLTSAQDSVSSAEKAVRESAAQKMENASANDPRLDPYLSRNASVYYGTATEQFYKEISWQDASLNAANQSLSTEQEALQTAQQQLATAQAEYAEIQNLHGTLRMLQDWANKMAAATTWTRLPWAMILRSDSAK